MCLGEDTATISSSRLAFPRNDLFASYFSARLCSAMEGHRSYLLLETVVRYMALAFLVEAEGRSGASS